MQSPPAAGCLHPDPPGRYSGNFMVVTTAVSPYADPSTFVEEGVSHRNPECLTNYPHLEVLARANPRRFVTYKTADPKVAAAAAAAAAATCSKQPGRRHTKGKGQANTAVDPRTEYVMQVTTPNRHSEIMLGVESALRMLCDERAGGRLHMREVNVLKLAAAGAGTRSATRSPSGSVYTETPLHRPCVDAARFDDAAATRNNVWVHVTHLDATSMSAPAADAGGGGGDWHHHLRPFRTPAQTFGFDLADVRYHRAGGCSASIGDEGEEILGPGVPWVASDEELSRTIPGIIRCVWN